MEEAEGGVSVSDEFTSDEKSDKECVECIVEDDMDNVDKNDDRDDDSNDKLVLQLSEEGTNIM